MKSFTVGKNVVAQDGACYVIAEIGNNHQGDLKTALNMIKVAAGMGVNAVKFQKRDNKALFTQAMYNKPYENENSYGATYGEHRDDLDFIVTPFDHPSVDFLEKVDIAAYKIASADITNVPLLEYVAKTGKPMFVSTGAATLDEIRLAYDTISKHNGQVCILHCTAGYPTEYENLNLRVITTLRETFPEAVIGYSGHDYGILAPSVAYMLGATVVEKHNTLNRSWKGTDHKFSLEPTGLHKMVRDLRRIDLSLGNGKKEIQKFEVDARKKMGKSLYAARNLRAGTVLTAADVVIKSPGGGMAPYRLDELVGKILVIDLPAEVPFAPEHVAGEQHKGSRVA